MEFSAEVTGEVAEAMASIHAITNKVLPEKSKGPLHAAAKAAEFISRQNRNGQAGDGALCDSCLAALRDGSDAAVPLRPTDGVPPAPLLHLNTGPSGASVPDERGKESPSVSR